ncbi:MAG: hypothetical protein LC753_06820 [Acidobacteria bacterium]|nr:hypothetical protein [Acidobacteriota bacterium]
MTQILASLLLVDDDRELTRVLAANAALRGYSCRSATSRTEALAALGYEAFDAVVIDPGPGESGLDVIPRIKELAPDAEIGDQVVRDGGIRVRAEAVRHRPAAGDGGACARTAPVEPA